MTENEAKTKWCHAFTASHTDPRAHFDGGFVHACIGGACMAWRWHTAEGETLIEGIRRHRDEKGSTLLDAKNYVEAHPEYLRRPPASTGWCGLAGKP